MYKSLSCKIGCELIHVDETTRFKTIRSQISNAERFQLFLKTLCKLLFDFFPILCSLNSKLEREQLLMQIINRVPFHSHWKNCTNERNISGNFKMLPESFWQVKVKVREI